MPEWKPIVGLSFQPDEFKAYCQSLQWTTWHPTFIVLHNSGEPTLASCPNGITKAGIAGLVKYYRDTMHWSAGPHVFADDRQIWVFTPLTTTGVHSPSWNEVSLGVEMLGDYDSEDFSGGRGLSVQKNAIAAVSILSSLLKLDPNAMRLHKEDPKTKHKHCPGKNVDKEKFIAEVIGSIAGFEDDESIAFLNLKVT